MAYRGDMVAHHDRMAELQDELARVIVKTEVDAAISTPASVLARYLVGCITAWDAATNQRDEERRWANTPPVIKPQKPVLCGDMVGDGIRCNLPRGHRTTPGQPSRCSNSDYF